LEDNLVYEGHVVDGVADGNGKVYIGDECFSVEYKDRILVKIEKL
jgi:hypothetical protein